MAKYKCPNCKRTLGCACKKRVAKDGTFCCNSCVTRYEKTLKT